jgi:hypothetical protein
MSEHVTEEGLGQPEEPETQPQPNSIMEGLRKKHQSLKSKKTLDLPIPGYDGALVAKYRLIGLKELEVIGNKVQREFKGLGERQKYASIDAIILACEGLYYNRDGKLVGLSESISDDEPPIKYDPRLVEFLNLDIETGFDDDIGPARRTVLALFGGDEHDIAILDHSNSIGRWSSDTSKQVGEAFLVES